MRTKQNEIERRRTDLGGFCFDLIRSLPRVGPFSFGVVMLPFALLGCGDGGEIEPPLPLYGEVPITYPMDLWDAEVRGLTMLRVRVTEEGLVDSVEVVEASGYPAFDSAAARGARKLQYRPAMRNGKRLTVWARVPVHFTRGGDPQ